MSNFTVRVSEHTVSVLPETHLDWYSFCIKVQRRVGGGAITWAICHMGRCLSVRGRWDWEPQPSSRTAAWLAKHSWPSEDLALERAKEAALALTINGNHARDLLPAEQG